MGDQHVKGAVSTAEGTVKEVAGTLTGDRKLETEGKVQDRLGDVQDAVHRSDHD